MVVMMYSVYRLVDPTEPWHYRYVGKTKGNLERRLNIHIRYALNAYANTTHKVNWLRTLLFAKPFRYPIIEVIESVDIEKEAFELEKHYIAKYRVEGYKLTNSTDGGEGSSGWKPSDETRAKISVVRKGWEPSDETRVKMSAAKKGLAPWNKGLKNIISEETRGKMSAAAKGNTSHLGKKHSDEVRRKMSISHTGKIRGKYHKSEKRLCTRLAGFKTQLFELS